MPPDRTPTRRYLVIIAISEYDAPSCPPLPGVRQDATHLRETLERHADGGIHRIVHLNDDQATTVRIRETMSRLQADTAATDQVTIYFGGHATRSRDRAADRWRYCLIPFDGTPISTDTFASWVSELPARELVLIFDCCHAGGLMDFRWTPATREELLEGWKSVYVMAAARGRETAAEEDNGSVFTSALCDALSGRGVAPDESGRISAQKAWSYAADLVRASTPRLGHQQIAVSGGISNPIYLTRCRRKAIASRWRHTYFRRLEADPDTEHVFVELRCCISEAPRFSHSSSVCVPAHLRALARAGELSDAIPLRRLFAESVVRGNRRAVLLIGGGGSGKSTLLGHLGQTVTSGSAEAFSLPPSLELRRVNLSNATEPIESMFDALPDSDGTVHGTLVLADDLHTMSNGQQQSHFLERVARQLGTRRDSFAVVTSSYHQIPERLSIPTAFVVAYLVPPSETEARDLLSAHVAAAAEYLGGDRNPMASIWDRTVVDCYDQLELDFRDEPPALERQPRFLRDLVEAAILSCNAGCRFAGRRIASEALRQTIDALFEPMRRYAASESGEVIDWIRRFCLISLILDLKLESGNDCRPQVDADLRSIRGRWADLDPELQKALRGPLHEFGFVEFDDRGALGVTRKNGRLREFIAADYAAQHWREAEIHALTHSLIDKLPYPWSLFSEWLIDALDHHANTDEAIELSRVCLQALPCRAASLVAALPTYEPTLVASAMLKREPHHARMLEHRRRLVRRCLGWLTNSRDVADALLAIGRQSEYRSDIYFVDEALLDLGRHSDATATQVAEWRNSLYSSLVDDRPDWVAWWDRDERIPRWAYVPARDGERGTRGFWTFAYPVTVTEWATFDPDLKEVRTHVDSFDWGEKPPVFTVSWYAAMACCRWIGHLIRSEGTLPSFDETMALHELWASGEARSRVMHATEFSERAVADTYYSGVSEWTRDESRVKTWDDRLVPARLALHEEWSKDGELIAHRRLVELDEGAAVAFRPVIHSDLILLRGYQDIVGRTYDERLWKRDVPTRETLLEMVRRWLDV